MRMHRSCRVMTHAAVLRAGAAGHPEGNQRYRQLLRTAIRKLYEARGEELWKTKRGRRTPRSSSAIRLGPGVVKGAYVRFAAPFYRYRPRAGPRVASGHPAW